MNKSLKVAKVFLEKILKIEPSRKNRFFDLISLLKLLLYYLVDK